MLTSRSILDPIRRMTARIFRGATYRLIRGASGSESLGIFGDHPLHYRMIHLSLGESAGCSIHRRFCGLTWERQAARVARQHGMAVIYHHPRRASAPFQSQMLRAYHFVPLVWEIGDSLQAYRAKLPRRLHRVIRKAEDEFSVRIHCDSAWASVFHEEYHRPAMVRRHGERGVVASVRSIQLHIERNHGEFICVLHQGKCTAAFFCTRVDDQFIFNHVGWLHGDESIAQSGALGAGYWYMIRRAAELGYRKVIPQSAWACLEDGLFEYKARWNAVLDLPSRASSTFGLLIRPDHVDTQRFFARHSLILQSPEGGYMVLSGKSSDQVQTPSTILQGFSAWFRLLPEPLDAAPVENQPLPDHLQRWARRER